jgi:FtsZ-interacting cell division protein YlmF
MEPLDDEATKISNEHRADWKHPIDSLNMTYSESRLSDFEREIAQLMATKMVQADKPFPNVSIKGVDPKKFEELQEQVKQLMDLNAVLQVELLEKKKVSGRRM